MNCRGMALVSGLLFLVAVALLAVTAAGSMTLQQQQAANFTDRQKARSSADLAESYAIAWLYSRDSVDRQTGCIIDCVLPVGIYRDDEIPDRPEFESAAWWQATATPAGRDPLSGDQIEYAATNPTHAAWIIEEIHFLGHQEDERQQPVSATGYYRIVSRGQGIHPGSVAINESIVARPWNEGVTASEFPPKLPLGEFCRQFSDDVACGMQSWRQRR